MKRKTTKFNLLKKYFLHLFNKKTLIIITTLQILATSALDFVNIAQIYLTAPHYKMKTKIR